MGSSLWPTTADNDTLVPMDVFQRARAGSGIVAHVAYQGRPEDWIVEKLGVPRETLRWSLNEGFLPHRWDGTPDPISAMLEALARWEDVGVESATGTGKSYTAACVILWFLACWKNSIVNTYAPKEDQLRLYIWKEIDSLWPAFQRLFPTAEKTDLRIRMDGTDKWSAHGIATAIRAGEDSATKAQGAHAPDMLLITEETPGIEPAIMTALRNTRTAAHNLQLALGNPDNQQDTLHQFCLLDGTTHIRISALDHPNVVCNRVVVPGAASPEGIARISAADEPDTPMYDSRVRGMSPSEAVQSLIKLAWVKAAALKYERLLLVTKGRWEGTPAIGLDVANSEKGDKSSRAFGRGEVLLQVVTKPCPNASILGDDTVDEAQSLGVAPPHIGVDPVGVGAATVNNMIARGYQPRMLGGALAPVTGAQRSPDGASMDFAPDANLFINLRAQMAWQLREDLRQGLVAIEPKLAERLARQLTAPHYERAGGKVILEEKKHIRKRLGASPDDFDSVMYWNWVRPRSTEAERREMGDDQHPGFDYKAKRRQRKTAPVNEDGSLLDVVEDDLRPTRFFGPTAARGYRMPRWGSNDAYDAYEGEDDE